MKTEAEQTIATGNGASVALLLEISDLSIGFFRRDKEVQRVVEDFSLSLEASEIFAVVGESGSGKTMVARSILNLLPTGARICGGAIRLHGENLLTASPQRMREIRGGQIGMVFQEPMVTLNPSLTIGEQMAEGLRLHTEMSDQEIKEQCVEMLRRVRVPNAEQCLSRYPHEFSGGMRQRILIASVMLLKPKLLVADEPTTALDVCLQAEILDLMVELSRENQTSVLLISHDLGIVERYARRVLVMQRGRVIETGTIRQVLSSPQKLYTKTLLSFLPRRPSENHQTVAVGEPLLVVRNLRVQYVKRFWQPWRKPSVHQVVRQVGLTVRTGETVAVVGESGSGKTTLGRAILRLKESAAGEILFQGENLLTLGSRRMRQLRRDLQIVFQDPASSLDPRMRVGDIIGEGLRHLNLGEKERRERVVQTIEEVGLPPDDARRFPHELSGGQRQRVAIGRAIITRPRLIVADEPVSALDVTVQARILTLLKDLQRNYGFSYLFITHDLGVVEQIADRVIVLYRGRILESGTRDSIFDQPQHPYTRRLLKAGALITGNDQGGFSVSARVVAETDAPPGTKFFDEADGEEPVMVEIAPEHLVACSSDAERTEGMKRSVSGGVK